MVIKKQMIRYELPPKRGMHFRNYYNAILKIAKDLGSMPISFIDSNEDERYVKITGEGFYLDGAKEPLNAAIAKDVILKNEQNFSEVIFKAIRESDKFFEYRGLLKLAVLSDESNYFDYPICFFIRDREKGLYCRFAFVPSEQGEPQKYFFEKDQVDEEFSIRFVTYYYQEILFQMRDAIINAQMKKYVDEYKKSGQEDAELRKEYGISSEKVNGKLIIRADSIFGKQATKTIDAEKAKQIAEAKAKIFGRKPTAKK